MRMFMASISVIEACYMKSRNYKFDGFLLEILKENTYVLY